LVPLRSVSTAIARAKGKRNTENDVDATDGASAPAQRVVDMVLGRSDEGTLVTNA